MNPNRAQIILLQDTRTAAVLRRRRLLSVRLTAAAMPESAASQFGHLPQATYSSHEPLGPKLLSLVSDLSRARYTTAVAVPRQCSQFSARSQFNATKIALHDLFLTYHQYRAIPR